jgi:phosphatidylserine/phosphatidylglycerophosphate/cardiolipin synthase-like enzyme
VEDCVAVTESQGPGGRCTGGALTVVGQAKARLSWLPRAVARGPPGTATHLETWARWSAAHANGEPAPRARRLDAGKEFDARLCVPLIRKRHRRNHRNHGPEQQECRGLRSFCGITTSRSRILPKGISTSLSAEDNGAVGVVVGGVEVYVGPPVLGAPDDLDAVIRDFLGAAKHSLAIAVQEVDSRSIADAILAAMQRGVRVQLILEGDYLVEAHPSADPWALAGEFEEDRIIHSAFLRAGVDVITDLNPAIFHQKFVVRDVGESTAAVLTGSTNFTLTDTGQNTSSGPVVGNNLNHRGDPGRADRGQRVRRGVPPAPLGHVRGPA